MLKLTVCGLILCFAVVSISLVCPTLTSFVLLCSAFFMICFSFYVVMMGFVLLCISMICCVLYWMGPPTDSGR